jgi:gamma-glutamyl hydrolase
VDSVNGILLTGGGLEADVLNLTSPYMAAAGRIFRRVQARNKSGSFLPMHGTCQGMQVLAILGAQDPSVLHERAFDSENMSLPLHLNASEVVDSRLLGPGTPAHVLDTLTRQNCTMNLHRDGIPPSAWWASPLLPPFFRLLSTNVDREGLPFVSTIEARDYPITATQWHPERPQFEFKPNVGVAHTRDAIEAMQYVAGFFVEDARRNTQSFANATLDTLLSMYAFPSVVDDTMPLLWGYSSFYFSL